MTTERVEDENAPDQQSGLSESTRPNPRFLYYFVIWDGQRPPMIAEAIMVNRYGPEPRKVTFDTEIVIPEPLEMRLRHKSPEAAALEEEVKTLCMQLRTEISRTAKLRVARNVGGEGVLVQYRYRLGEQSATEELPAADIPEDVAAAIVSGAALEADPTYTRWYWRYLDKRRDELISQELERKYGDGTSAQKAP